MLSIFIVVVVGVILICWAHFSDEPEEKKLQDQLSTLWVLCDDYKKRPLSRHTQMTQRLLRAIGSVIDRIFGDRLISVRSIGVSFWYAIACNLVVLLAILGNAAIRGPGIYSYYMVDSHGVGPSVTVTEVSAVFATCLWLLGVAAGLGVIGTLPLYTSRPIWLGCWIAILLAIAGYLYPSIGHTHSSYLTMTNTTTQHVTLKTTAVTFVAFSHPVRVTVVSLFTLLAVAVPTGFVALFRLVLRGTSALDSLWRMMAAILVYALTALGFVFAPALVAYLTPWSAVIANNESAMQQIVGTSVALLAPSNLLPMATSALSLLFMLGLLIHRLFWPFVQRPLYALQRMDTDARKKLLAGAGKSLVGVGLAGAGVRLLPNLFELLR